MRLCSAPTCKNVIQPSSLINNNNKSEFQYCESCQNLIKKQQQRDLQSSIGPEIYQKKFADRPTSTSPFGGAVRVPLPTKICIKCGKDDIDGALYCEKCFKMINSDFYSTPSATLGFNNGSRSKGGISSGIELPVKYETTTLGSPRMSNDSRIYNMNMDPSNFGGSFRPQYVNTTRGTRSFTGDNDDISAYDLKQNTYHRLYPTRHTYFKN